MTVVINGTTGIDTGTGSLIAADATTPTYLDLFEDTDNGSNYVRLIAPTSVAANRTVTLPDGTGTVAVNNVSGVLVSGTAVASTSGTAINFNNVIPSWAKQITVMLSGVSVNGTANGGFVQLGTGATPTYTTTGYVGVGSQIGASTVSSGNYTAGFQIINQGSTAATVQGLITITNLTGNTWTAFGATSENGSGRQFISSGAITLAAALTSIRISHADTFDAGTINIMWE